MPQSYPSVTYQICAHVMPFQILTVYGHGGEVDNLVPDKMELEEAMRRYTSPVNPAVFPHVAVALLAIGMFFTSWFFIYEVTSTKYTRPVNFESCAPPSGSGCRQVGSEFRVEAAEKWKQRTINTFIT
ncbi:hypothetical protein GH733_002695 [Mirounga leonina]|nr:hypothetical protein GH733_002695 [Mirounga leonina]